MASTEATFSIDIQPFLVDLAQAYGATARAFRRMSGVLALSKCTRGEASVWLRQLLPGAWKQRHGMMTWEPTTAELRKVIHGKFAPRAVKCHLYSMLQVRRNESRRRRHGHRG